MIFLQDGYEFDTDKVVIHTKYINSMRDFWLIGAIFNKRKLFPKILDNKYQLTDKLIEKLADESGYRWIIASRKGKSAWFVIPSFNKEPMDVIKGWYRFDMDSHHILSAKETLKAVGLVRMEDSIEKTFSIISKEEWRDYKLGKILNCP